MFSSKLTYMHENVIQTDAKSSNVTIRKYLLLQLLGVIDFKKSNCCALLELLRR